MNKNFNIGRALKTALKERKMTQADLAKIIGTSPAAVSQFAGRHGAQPETVEKLSRAFGLSPSEFVKLGES